MLQRSRQALEKREHCVPVSVHLQGVELRLIPDWICTLQRRILFALQKYTTIAPSQITLLSLCLSGG